MCKKIWKPDSVVYDAILLIYEKLSREDLLNRCLGGFTQNANGSFNSTIWALALKSMSSEKITLQTAAHIVTCIFNDGMNSILRIMEALEFPVGTGSYKFARKRDEQHVKLASAPSPMGPKLLIKKLCPSERQQI